MAVSSCIRCGARLPLGKSYCNGHNPRRGRNGSAYRRKRADWLAAHPVCVDCGQVGHKIGNKLTVDHLDRLVDTGGVDTGRWATRCQRCNRKRG